MSYQSRQKKRKHKNAVTKAKRTYASETAAKWFLTLARKDCRCHRCRLLLKRKAEIVYRHEPKEIRCVRCASMQPDSKGFTPSIRWERAKRRERQQQLAA